MSRMSPKVWLANILVAAATRISSQRVQQERRMRINPLRGITPERVATALDRFDAGYLRDFALIAHKIEQRDDMVISVRGKRLRDVAEKGYEILTIDDTPEAQRHKEFLEDLYNHVTATSVIDPNEQRGFSLLVKQMMDAVGKRWSVHELIWQPAPEGALRLTAKHVPLWYFENLDGPLRYLESPAAQRGEDLEDDAWMVTAGDGLMESTAIAYLFKRMALQDWVAFSEKFGLPMVLGKSGAQPGSEQWDAMVEAVRSIGHDWGGVVSEGSSIDLIETRNSGTLPFPALVDTMDRKIATIWRGGDLSTMSQKEGVGAEMQDDEKDVLLKDDAEMISETLNTQVGRPALAWRFGDAAPLAYLRIKVPTRINVDEEIKISSHLALGGAPVAIADELERFGRSLPSSGEPLMSAVMTPDSQALSAASLANEDLGSPAGARRLLGHRRHLAQAYARDLAAVREELARIQQIQDPALYRHALREFAQALPEHLRRIAADSSADEALAGILAAEFFNGLEEAQKQGNPDS